MKDAIELIIAGSAIWGLVTAYRQEPHARSDKNGLAAGGLYCVVLGGFLYELSYSPKGELMQILLLGLLGATVVLQLRKNALAPQCGVSGKIGPLVYASPILASFLFLVNAVMNPNLPLSQSIGRLASVLFVLLVVILCIISRLSLQIISKVVVMAVLSVLALTPIGGNNWRACDIFKCGPFGAIYTGSFASENGLAIIVSVAILCTFGFWQGWKSSAVLLPLVLTVFAAESRTSQIALIIAVAVWFLVRFGYRSSAVVATGPRLLFVSVIAGIFVVGISLVYTSAPTAFSNRGNVWLRGTKALGEDWVFGLGLERWFHLQRIGYLPGLFPHSEYLLILFSGGILSLIALFAIMAGAVTSVASDVRSYAFVLGYVVYLCILGLTEAFWNPIAIDGHSFLVIPLIVSALRNNEGTALVVSKTKITQSKSV